MSDIYVKQISDSVTYQQLDEYFSNPTNGGGKIHNILYPLPDRTAVISFDDAKVAEEALKRKHQLLGNLDVAPLPRKVARHVIVEVDKDCSQFMYLNTNVVAELQVLGQIRVDFQHDKGMYVLQGSWVQMEWALHYIRTMYEIYDFKYVASRANETKKTIELQTKKPTHQCKTKSVKAYDVHESAASKPKADESGDFMSRGYDIQTESDVDDDDDDDDDDDHDEDDDDNNDAAIYGFTVNQRRQAYSPLIARGIDVHQIDFGDTPKTLTFELNKGLKVLISMDDITKKATDAIVNPTNREINNNYGVSRAIQAAVGVKFKLVSRKFLLHNGPLQIADVFYTSGGGKLNKNVNFILHTIAPRWREDNSECSEHMLVCTYLNCFMYGENKLWLKSLAMPLISAGALGFPLDVCVRAFFDALLLFSMNTNRTRHLSEIHVVCFDQESTAASVMIMRSLLDCDFDQAGAAATESYRTLSSHCLFKAKYFEQFSTQKYPQLNPSGKGVTATRQTVNPYLMIEQPDSGDDSTNEFQLQEFTLNDSKARQPLQTMDETHSKDVKQQTLAQEFLPKKNNDDEQVKYSNNQENKLSKMNEGSNIPINKHNVVDAVEAKRNYHYNKDSEGNVKSMHEFPQHSDVLKFSVDKTANSKVSDNYENEVLGCEEKNMEEDNDVAELSYKTCYYDDTNDEFIADKELKVDEKMSVKSDINNDSVLWQINKEEKYMSVAEIVSTVDIEEPARVTECYVSNELGGNYIRNDVLDDFEEKEDKYCGEVTQKQAISGWTSNDVHNPEENRNNNTLVNDWSMHPSLNQLAKDESLEADEKVELKCTLCTGIENA